MYRITNYDKRFNINTMYRVFKKYPDSEGCVTTFKNGLAELAYTLAPRFSRGNDLYGSIPELYRFMWNYAITHITNDFLNDVTYALSKEFY